MAVKKVAVIMGSDSDFPTVSAAIKRLKALEIPVEVHVMSAHRTPHAAAEFAQNAVQNGFGVIIAAAGKAAHLGGVLAAHTTLPVIAIPISPRPWTVWMHSWQPYRCPAESRWRRLQSTAPTMQRFWLHRCWPSRMRRWRQSSWR